MIDKHGKIIKSNQEILDRYQELYPGPTPKDQPWLFNPTSPPQGWQWDYETEYWYKL